MPQTRPLAGSPDSVDPSPTQVVLVVDDESLILEVLALVLQSEGYQVVCQQSGGAALAWLQGHRTDLMLLDFMMPGMDGAALGCAVRASPAHRAVPIIISSALPERTVRDRFPHYDAYLQKPYDMERLIQTVAKLLASQD